MTLKRLRHMVHWHWQNLDEDREHRVKGKGWLNGRAWFNVGQFSEERFRYRYELGVQWVLGSIGHTLIGAAVELGDGDSEQDGAARLHVPGAHLYLNLASPLMRRLTSRLCRNRCFGCHRTRAFAVELRPPTYDFGVSWKLWTDPWGEDDPAKWRAGRINFRRALLGHSKHLMTKLEEREVLIPMPEGAYPATATLFASTWTHERVPWWPARRLVRCEIEIPGGIAFPGKGENAWDCDDDAVFSMTMLAGTIPEAIGRLVASVLRDRERYGGKD